MKSILLLLLLAVLSAKNDAAKIRDSINIDLPKNMTLDDPNFDTPIELLFVGDDNDDVDINRANLSVGNIGSSDRSLYRTYFNRGAIANTVQIVNINFRAASSSTRITAIRATEQGTSQNAAARITAGGLGSSTVTIRLTSVRGRGFHYLVQIWGR